MVWRIEVDATLTRDRIERNLVDMTHKGTNDLFLPRFVKGIKKQLEVRLGKNTG